MKNRRKIHEIDSTNDIRYRGPLNYQHLRIAAWLLMALTQIGIMMQISLVVFPEGRYYNEDAVTVISFLKELALPLFLIANFSTILSAKADYKKLLIKFGALAGGVIVLYIYVYERFVLGFLSKAMTREAADAAAGDIIADKGFIAFNLFLDLFLCTLVMFFLNYRPKRVFVGKMLIVFRCFAIIPILYEAIAVMFKILAGVGKTTLSPLALPFLTTKPPMTFVVFIALALFLKRRERKFIKNGKTHEEYQVFLMTNSNSWHFSVYAAVIMAAAAVLDLIIAVVIAVVLTEPVMNTEMYETVMDGVLEQVERWGFGGSVSLLLVAPVMLLFSYNRKPRFPKLDILIPIAGVFFIAVEYFEAAFFFIMHLN